MVGIKYDFPIKDLRDKLLSEHHIFVGNASDPTVLRLLPPLNITKAETDRFLAALYETVSPPTPTSPPSLLPRLIRDIAERGTSSKRLGSDFKSFSLVIPEIYL